MIEMAYLQKMYNNLWELLVKEQLLGRELSSERGIGKETNVSCLV